MSYILYYLQIPTLSAWKYFIRRFKMKSNFTTPVNYMGSF